MAGEILVAFLGGWWDEDAGIVYEGHLEHNISDLHNTITKATIMCIFDIDIWIWMSRESTIYALLPILAVYPNSRLLHSITTRPNPKASTLSCDFYNNDSPNPHLTSEHPLLTVCCAPISSTPGSSVGLTSTKSIATKHPVS